MWERPCEWTIPTTPGMAQTRLDLADGPEVFGSLKGISVNLDLTADGGLRRKTGAGILSVSWIMVHLEFSEKNI